MTRLPLILRFLALFLILSSPFAVMGGVVYAWPGAAGGLIIGDLLVLAVAFRSEGILLRAFGAKRVTDPALKASFDAVVHAIQMERGGFDPVTSPHLAIYPDPRPNTATLHALGSSGTVLISQGLMGQLDEAELRAVLREAILRIDESEWSFSTLCAALGALLLLWMPEEWVALFFSGETRVRRAQTSPISFFKFLCVYPWFRFVLALPKSAPPSVGSSEAWLSAMQKIDANARRTRTVRVPAAVKLFLADPTPCDQLIRLTE